MIMIYTDSCQGLEAQILFLFALYHGFVCVRVTACVLVCVHAYVHVYL